MQENDGTKSPIELTVGGMEDSPMTKSVVTDGQNKTLKSLAEGTYLFLQMKSEYSQITGSDAYLDYQGSDKSIKYTTTRGKVGSDNKVLFDDDLTVVRTRYWDDAHARSSMLSIWAVACNDLPYLGGTGTDLIETSNIFYNAATIANGNTTSTVPSNKPWQTSLINAKCLPWNVPHGLNSAQTETTLKNRDLLFSNNLANNPGSDGRLKFNTTTNPKGFMGGELVFYHAMSKITVKIKIGDGFTGTNDFRFPSNKNIRLSNFNIWGQFDAEAGEFKSCNTENKDVNSIYNTTGATPNVSGTEPAYVLEALVIPFSSYDSKPTKGSQFSSTGDHEMMEISIDNSNYKVSSKQLFDAIKENAQNGIAAGAAEINMEAGKNYICTFTVGKTKIKNITAQVVDWEDVTAENVTPSNARIKLQLEERGTTQNSDVAFYKAEDNKTTDGIDDNYAVYNWKSGYTNMNATYSTDHWTTSLFWQSNKDFYHFRALMPAATGITTDGSGDGDYATLTSAASYTDIRWGAPMKDDGTNETAGTFKWTYDPTTNGFDNAEHSQIYKAIGPTEDPVKLILFHMMSELTFTLSTTTGTDKVDFGDGSDAAHSTKIELTGFKSSGKLLLGNGLVKATSTAGASTVNTSLNTNSLSCTYGAVPQDLTNVVLVITTPDNNQYKVAMKNVLATSVTNNNIANPYTQDGSKWKIDYWYPGFKYNYSFTLKKTGITDLQATVVDWETVTAGDDDVKIE